MIIRDNHMHIKGKLNSSWSPMVSFALCSLSMLLVLLSVVEKNGIEGTLFTGDLLELYIPAIRSLANCLRTGDSISFSWNLFLGMDAIEYYTSVAGGSLFNVLYFFFLDLSPEIFIMVSIVGKTGFVGAAFAYFAKRVLKVPDAMAVMFSLFYAICGFQVVVNCVNLIWIDLLYMLPMILTLLVRFCEERKWVLLVLSYTYSFLCNFYIAYIVGIFSAVFVILYLFLYLFPGKRIVDNGKRLLTYGLYVVLSIGLAAFAMLPTACFLLQNQVEDASIAGEYLVTKNILTLLSRFTYGIPWEQYNTKPYLYCGIVVILLIPYFFLAKRISKQEKILFGSLLGLMLVSCCSLPLYLLWHGFDAPDQWYARFTFCICFLCVSMGCKAFSVLGDVGKKPMALGTVLSFFLWSIVIEYSGWVQGNLSKRNILLNQVLIIAWLLYLLLEYFCKEKYRKYWILFGTILAMVEVAGNGYTQYTLEQNKNEIQQIYAENEAVSDLLESDHDFYRVNCNNLVLENSDTLGQYCGITDFCSFENYHLRSTLSKLGMYGSPRVMSNQGLNPLTRLLLGIKYDVYFPDYETKQPVEIALSGGYEGIGFWVDRTALDLSLDKENIYENCNAAVQALTGISAPLFEEIPQSRITVSTEGSQVNHDYGITEIMREDQNSDIVSVSYSLPYEEKEVYATFMSSSNVMNEGSPIIYNYEAPADYGSLGVTYSKKMDRLEDKWVCSIAMIHNQTEDYGCFEKVLFYEVNLDTERNIHEALAENAMEVLDYGNGYLQGRVQVTDPNRILFLSVPLIEGWKVVATRLDGVSDTEKVEIVPVLEDAFLGLSFSEEGLYEFRLYYEAPGWNAGCLISGISLIIFVVLLVFGITQKKKVDNIENVTE